MAALRPALAALGWTYPQQQVAMVQLLAFCGKAQDLLPPPVQAHALPGLHQARMVAEDTRLFASDAAALTWLRNATQALFFSRQDYAATQAESGFFAHNRETLLPLLEILGMTGERQLTRQDYAIMLIPGGNEDWAKQRMEHAEYLLKEGMRPEHIVLLGSNRMLMPELERESLTALLADTLQEPDISPLTQVIDEALNDPVLAEIDDIYARNLAQSKHIMTRIGVPFSQWPTEADLMEWLYDKTMQHLPASQRQHTCHIVSSPMIRPADGARIEENTPDTFRDFASLDIAQEGGAILSVSHQPYALHQHGQLRVALPETNFPVVETVVPVVTPEEVNLHHALGCLAKYIYAMHDSLRDKAITQEAAGLQRFGCGPRFGQKSM